jgi:putative membrane protein
MLRLFLAWVHLLALGIGLASVWGRARAASSARDASGLRRLFAADSVWGLAALLWLTTGLWRLFAGTEKQTDYYFANHAFWLKMAMFILVFVLELWPMVTLIRWRIAARAAVITPDSRIASRIATISYVQCVIVSLMVAAAVAMARGYGQRS